MQPAMTAAPKKRSLLIWLVVVLLLGPCCVGGIGVLAAIAIPPLVRYVRQSKTSEAYAELRSLARLEEQYCTEHGSWLVPAGPVPATPSREKQLGVFSADPAFAQLGFDPGLPVYFSYAIEPDPMVSGGVRLVAHGDLDGDLAVSTYSVACGAGCTCATAPQIENEID